MAYTIVVHMISADPIVGEMNELPSVTDTLIRLTNPRRLDGKDIHYLSENAISVFWPIDRVNFIEVLGEEHEEEIIGFVRE